MKHLNQFARIPVCGAISGYNNTEIEYGPRIQPIIIKSQVLMHKLLLPIMQMTSQMLVKHLHSGCKKIKTKTSVKKV